ncbi:MAG: T9SS C-terminal target domain-containing protein [Ignavibacteriae bacterium]|nr:MAG: T9SS C-terminal target domain-containing protein [Ignavibacteriota bacterium]
MKFLTVLLTLVMLTSINFLNAQQRLYGDTTDLGDGIVYTWVDYNNQGTRDLIGVSMTQDAFNNLPTTANALNLLLPVSGTDTLFNHIFFNWNPMGHTPGYWTAPHFDIHFMMVSIAERQAVIGGPDSIIPAPYIPQDYIVSSPVVPQMGAHWVDSTSPELHGQTFTHTLIYGFYRTKMFFVEPMITLAYLQTNPNVTLTIKQPAQYMRTGYYPTLYTISYDASGQKYDIVLKDFIFRTGTPIGIQNISANIPGKFTIYQNYPNPFNPNTNIKFDIPEKSFVKLAIFNSLGQEIASLVNEELNAGTYNADWNASNYPSGVYFYKLTTGSFTETKKMILLK